jgi:hypothetical protein
MLQLASTFGQIRRQWLTQSTPGGNVLLDITVPAPAAAAMVAKAKHELAAA